MFMREGNGDFHYYSALRPPGRINCHSPDDLATNAMNISQPDQLTIHKTRARLSFLGRPQPVAKVLQRKNIFPDLGNGIDNTNRPSP